MVAALVEEAERIVAEGVEARIANADAGAQAEADKARAELLELQGDDVNKVEERIVHIRGIASDKD